MPGGLNPYTNPNTSPYVGAYKWEPPARNGIGGSVPGPSYANLVMVRGQCRNDVPEETDSEGNILTAGTITVNTPIGTIVSGQPDWPIWNAFRPLMDPTHTPPSTSGAPFILEGANLAWSVSIPNMGNSISCMTLYYTLTVDINDQGLNLLLTGDDLTNWQNYINNPSSAPKPNISWPKYAAAKITARKPGQTTADEFPADSSELLLTGFTSTTAGKPRQLDLMFGKGQAISGYTVRDLVTIAERYQDLLPTLTLSLYQVFLFNAQMVNLEAKQVPCSLLQYAYEVNFNWDPLQGSDYYPNDASDPTFYLKMFHPEDLYGTIGMAHAIELRFLLFGVPVAPGDIGAVLTNNTWMVVFIGPTPGRKQLQQTCTMRTLASPGGRIINMDLEVIAKEAVTLQIERYTGATTSTAPATGAPFEVIYQMPLSPPPAYGGENPLIQPFAYFYAKGKKTDWYRTRQIYNNQNEFAGAWHTDGPWSEKTLYEINADSGADPGATAETITRRVPITDGTKLPDNPVAIFLSTEDQNVVQNQVYSAGLWTTEFSACSIDPSELADTHLVARYWLVPQATAAAGNLDDILANLGKNEFYFTETSSGTRLNLGTPSSLSQLSVSPPLTAKFETISLSRYAEPPGGGTTGTVSGIPTGNWVLAAGLFPLSVPTPDGVASPPDFDSTTFPHIQVTLDPTTTVESSLLYNVSSSIFATRWMRYAQSQYLPYGAPNRPYGALTAGRLLTDGSTLTGSGSFLLYNKTTNLKSGSNATAGLSELQEADTETLNIYVPVTDVPAQVDPNESISVDFATGGQSLAAGRVASLRKGVGGNTWSVKWSLDLDVDNDVIGYQFRVEGLLVDSSGVALWRIFRSPIITWSKTSADYTYSFENTIPFIIQGEDVQFVYRITAMPYSLDGNSVDLQKVKSDLGSKPLGLRLTNVQIAQHTLETLDFTQTASLLGSPAFYEQLPTVPSRTIGSKDFWYIADDSNLVTMFIDATIGAPITGTMYSPVWFIDLPAGIEVKVRSSALGSNLIWVRTVPSSSSPTSNPVYSTSASHHLRTGLTHLSTQQGTPTDGSNPGSMHYIMMPGYASPHWQEVVKDSNGNKFTGLYPHVFHISRGTGDHSGSLLGLISEQDDNVGPLTNFSVSASGDGGMGTFGAPSVHKHQGDFAAVARLASGLQYPSAVSDRHGSFCYVTGWSEPGSIVCRIAQIEGSGASGQGGPGSNFLVDGSSSLQMPDSQSYITPLGGPTGVATEGWSAVFTDDRNTPVVLFMLDGHPATIYGRRLKSISEGFEEPFIAVDLTSTGASSNLQLYGPSAAVNPHTGHASIAYWCDGKILVSTYNRPSPGANRQTVISPIMLGAGDSTLASSAELQSLKAANLLFTPDPVSGESDVPKQRPGITYLRDSTNAHQLAIYYLDQNGALYGRILKPFSPPGPPFLIDSTGGSGS